MNWLSDLHLKIVEKVAPIQVEFLDEDDSTSGDGGPDVPLQDDSKEPEPEPKPEAKG